MNILYILFGLLAVSSFVSPTRAKSLRSLLSRNERRAKSEGRMMLDDGLVRRRKDYSYRRQILLPVCHNVKPPANGVFSCTSSSYGDEIMRCLASCNGNNKFADGSREKVIVCTTENQDSNWNIIAQIPSCGYEDGNELLDMDNEILSSLPACASLKPPRNGLFICKIDYSYKNNIMECVPSCDEGFEFTDSTEGMAITCIIEDQGDSWNSYIQIPSCKPKNRSTRCEKNLTARNQRQVCFENEFVRRCDATCVGGYSFPNGERRMRITCPKSTGVFTPVDKFPDCQ